MKIVGTLCCLHALPKLVCKIWWVNFDNQHWEDEEGDQKWKNSVEWKCPNYFCHFPQTHIPSDMCFPEHIIKKRSWASSWNKLQLCSYCWCGVTQKRFTSLALFYKIIKSFLLLLRLARERNIYQLLDEVGQNIVPCQWRADQLFVEAEQLDDIAHEQTIICRQFFTGHVVGSRSMKRKKNWHRMTMIFNQRSCN